MSVRVSLREGISACKAACPTGMNVQEYLALAARGAYEESWRVMMLDNPLPGVTARVCHHPCEQECVRGDVDEPLSIRAVRRFVTDTLYASPEFEPPGPLPVTREEKIAIIGAGPAGLSCAYYLANMGYGVTIFEALPVAGGMLAVGVPDYQLPKEILRREISHIKKLGVRIELNCRVGTDVTPTDLVKQGYRSVFIAVGAHRPNRLNVPGEELSGILDAVSFLKEVNTGRKVELGRNVVVIGGGDVAMDAARVALRSGADSVQVMCLEEDCDMPAAPWKVAEVAEEGIAISCCMGPSRFVGSGGRLTGIQALRAESVFNAQGQFDPRYVPGTEADIAADTIILAVGQRPDLSFLDSSHSLTITEAETIEVNPDTLTTSAIGMFAGGDVVTGTATVVEAIAAGKRAARSIDRFLSGDGARDTDDQEATIAKPDDDEKVLQHSRLDPPLRPSSERREDFAEVEGCLTEREIMEEASRCLACSKCNGCEFLSEPQCLKACPGDLMAIDPETGKSFICEPSDCWDCLACVKACPRRAIETRLPYQLASYKASLIPRVAKDKIYWTCTDTSGKVEEFVTKTLEAK